MGKIGRNNPCPCGSGKKFKKCCISIYGKNYKLPTPPKMSRSEFSRYLSKYETGHVLDLIISLQLEPENHGKNIRIELMAAEAIRNLSKGVSGNYKKLRSIISHEFNGNYREDLPEELFTENVLFHGGNYTVMPGIITHGVDIFKYLTESIFISKNELPTQLKDEIRNGVLFLLSTGEVLFEQAQLKSNWFVESNDRTLKIPQNIAKFSLNSNELKILCNRIDISPSTIRHFIIKPDEPNLDDPYHSPLFYKPFVVFDNEYYFVLPSCQMSALNDFILRVALKHKARNEIHQLCHKKIWKDVLCACDKMGWRLMGIQLPESSDQSIIEGVFLVDTYRLAYVCYSFPSKLQSAHEMYLEQNGDLLGGEELNNRMRMVIMELKSRKEWKDYQFLTLNLIASMGGFIAMGIEEPQEKERRASFNAFDFINLAKAGEWDRLDLWKYAKVYECTTQKTKILATSKIDVYATYKRNGETFYLSDKYRPDLLTIVPGDGADFIRKAKIKSDIHGAVTLINNSVAYCSVRRYRDFAPIYKPEKQRIPYEILVKSYDFALWVQNYQAKSSSQANYVEHIADAICFWLDRLYPALHYQLNTAISLVLNMILEFDLDYFNPLPIESLDSTERITGSFQCSYNKNNLTIRFPKGIRKLFIGGSNAGERTLMAEILNGLNIIPGISLSDQYISDSLDQYIPLGPAKMILMIDTRTDLRLDPRWLVPPLYISDAEINLLLDDLVEIVNRPEPIPERFQSIGDKKTFCNQVVLSLIRHLKDKLKIYDAESLIKKLIAVYEVLIQIGEFTKIQTAAKVHCFGDDENELEKILNEQKKLVNTSLASRCLIEFAVLNSININGTCDPNYDQLDELLSIMNEILNYGMISDSLHFGMDNPEIGLLPSGRIGISRGFFDEKLQSFYKDNTIANIEAQLETFSSSFETYGSKEIDADTKSFSEKVDEAFLYDWGIDYTNLNDICFHAAEMAEEREKSVISMLESDLISELKQTMSETADQIESGLEKLRFEYKPEIVTDQDGYTNSDYFPWKYNREFSYARRPFIVVETIKGRRYYWGMRQCIAASQYLQQLLFSTSLTHGGSKINSLLGEIRNKNGKLFRNNVAAWLKNNSSLVVRDDEITIKKNGHFKADKDYGDCDILAYDPSINVVYNIECKRTVAARNIHQMKKEMDDYLGRAGQKKKVAKHVERDNWLQANLNEVKNFVGATELPIVKSIILTSELIPTRYLREGEILLPIISFRELKRNGFDELRNC